MCSSHKPRTLLIGALYENIAPATIAILAGTSIRKGPRFEVNAAAFGTPQQQSGSGGHPGNVMQMPGMKMPMPGDGGHKHRHWYPMMAQRIPREAASKLFLPGLAVVKPEGGKQCLKRLCWQPFWR